MSQPLRVRVEGDALLVTDPLLRRVPATRVTFLRTLRLPDDGRTWPLPPGLGSFPIRTVASLGERAPAAMRERGGVVIPMYQAEAMWISFDAPDWRPMAFKVGAGMVNAVDAGTLDGDIRADRADYLVSPPQPWLDGFKTGAGTISQFVAMPLGSGVTVEAQLTGAETVGGLQVLVAGPKPGRFRTTPPPRVHREYDGVLFKRLAVADAPMGLAAGGRMEQKVYPDPHGPDTWDAARAARIWVHIVPASAWTALTGEPRPSAPASREAYERAGLPWFALYDEAFEDVPVHPRWAGVRTVHALTDDDPEGTTLTGGW